MHVRGGTILKTTNKHNPIKFPEPQPDGTVKFVDRSDELVKKLKDLKFDAIINIGGDGSQKISDTHKPWPAQSCPRLRRRSAHFCPHLIKGSLHRVL